MEVRLGLRLASLGSRALAQFIDALLVQAIQAVLLLIGGMVSVGFGAVMGFDGEDYGWLLAIVFVLVSLATGLWFIVFELAWQGQTPGKRWVGIRVVTDDGQVPDAAAILIRNVMRLVDFLPGSYLIGVLVMLGSAQNRRLGDIAAGTLVIAEDRAALPARDWPEGLTEAQRQLLELWFRRVDTLPPDRREALALRLLSRVGRPPDPALGAAGTLEAWCPRRAPGAPQAKGP